MSYQALELDGNGYASIADASQKGLNMGLSDFMMEVLVKIPANTGGNQHFMRKRAAGIHWFFRASNADFLGAMIEDGVDDAQVRGQTNIVDGLWRYCVWVVDRSSATGMKLFVGGSEDTYSLQENPAPVGNIDNAGTMGVGANESGDERLTGFLDEVRIWNFGYGGLPGNYADYIAWRAAGRNVFLDVSNFSSGAWNGYADADRTEIITDPGIESWTGDTPDDWVEAGESGGVRDITKETTEKHGGSAAAKLEATSNDGTSFLIREALTLVANEYYEVSGWIYFASRTAGNVEIKLFNATDGSFARTLLTSTNGAYTYYQMVGKPTVISSDLICNFYNETTTGVVYFDDISVKRVGLVARYKFSGNYNDETANANHLTAGGSGNTFPGYSLRSKAQKMLLGVG